MTGSAVRDQVVIVHPQLVFYGGAEVLLTNMTTELVRIGWEITIVTLFLSDEVKAKFDPQINFIAHKIGGEYVPRSTNFVRALGVLLDIFKLRRLLKQAPKAAVLNLHNFPSTWVSVWQHVAKRVVWNCNEPPGLWNNPNPSFALQLVALVGGWVDRVVIRSCVDSIVVSDQLNHDRVIQMYGLPAHVLQYGIDYNFFSSIELDDAQGLPPIEGAPVIVHVGFIGPSKNQLFSIDALRDILPNHPQSRLVFAGQGSPDYITKVHQKLAVYGLKDRVIFLGHVTQRQVRALYQVADVALFPTDGQGGWLSPLEAIVCGTPIVVRQSAPAAGVISEHQLGEVTDDFAAAIERLMENKAAQAEKSKRAKAWVEEHISWNHYAKSINRIYDVSSDGGSK